MQEKMVICKKRLLHARKDGYALQIVWWCFNSPEAAKASKIMTVTSRRMWRRFLCGRFLLMDERPPLMWSNEHCSQQQRPDAWNKTLVNCFFMNTLSLKEEGLLYDRTCKRAGCEKFDYYWICLMTLRNGAECWLIIYSNTFFIKS